VSQAGYPQAVHRFAREITNHAAISRSFHTGYPQALWRSGVEDGFGSMLVTKVTPLP
jgi:hypothetical protein